MFVLLGGKSRWWGDWGGWWIKKKKCGWVSAFAHNSLWGRITLPPPPFKQSDNLLDPSDGHKNSKTISSNTRRGRISRISTSPPPPHHHLPFENKPWGCGGKFCRQVNTERFWVTPLWQKTKQNNDFLAFIWFWSPVCQKQRKYEEVEDERKEVSQVLVSRLFIVTGQ